MIDLLGKKRIAELEKELQVARAALATAELGMRNQANQIEYLVRELRNMDDKIFTMSQQTDWAAMRPYFATLKDEMMVRKTIESKRITEILRPELTQAYATEPKQIKGSR